MISNLHQLHLPASAGLAACDVPEMTEQAYLTHLEEQWQPGTQLNSGLCENAAGKGWLAVLRWLRQNGAPWDRWTCSAAANGDHLAVLEWALSQGCPWPWDSKAIDTWHAAYAGRHAFLNWARQEGMSDHMEKHACAHAAGGGQMATLRWMRRQGWDWNWRVCAYAAGRGHLAILHWARQHGCAWSAETCTEAAKGGHLAILRWARENGCPWNKDTTQAALVRRHLTLYLWARRNSCPSRVATQASAHRIVQALTTCYLVLRSAAPLQLPAEVLRSIVLKGHEVD